MATTEEIRQAFANCRLFDGFSTDDHAALLLIAERVSFVKGEQIFTIGSPKDESFYLLVKGRADVLSPTKPGQFDLQRGPGEILGEIGQVNPQGKRTRTVVAGADCEMLEWSFDRIAARQPELCKRLKDVFEKVAFERLSQDFA